MISLLLSFALAAPGEFVRTRDALAIRRFTTVSGDPARGRRANPGGAYEAWVFRDGVVERYRRYAGRAVVEERTFDALGGPIVTLAWDRGVATKATVHGIVERTLDLADWRGEAVGGMTALVPKEAVVKDDVLRVDRPDLYLEVRWADGPVDVWSDRFRDALALNCACILVDRATGFVANKAGARYLVTTPDPAGSRLGERWAVPGPKGRVLLVSYDVPMTLDGTPVAEDRYPAALAVGRTVLATAKW